MRTLETVGLAAFADRSAAQLSGGQQQRLALARALVAEPRLLLLDEPLSNLDALLREQMRIELRRLQKEVGVTAVYVTHDQSEALALSDRIAVMHNGRIAQIGTPQQIYHQPRNAFVAELRRPQQSAARHAVGARRRTAARGSPRRSGPVLCEAPNDAAVALAGRGADPSRACCADARGRRGEPGAQSVSRPGVAGRVSRRGHRMRRAGRRRRISWCGALPGHMTAQAVEVYFPPEQTLAIAVGDP